MKITFTNVLELEGVIKPEPASKFIPDWYKKLNSYLNNEKKPDGNGRTTATAKKCMPIFDAIISGYIITLPADVYVSIKEGVQYFEWANFDLIAFHPVEQASGHPKANGHAYPKFMNPWAIKTPKGYSTLFIQPMHRESVFTIMAGIVDTDTYNMAVNFPFVINDPNFEGLIPKGTPIAQVIPVKRENWQMKLGTKKDLIKIKITGVKLQTLFFDKYKTMFWNKKEFK